MLFRNRQLKVNTIQQNVTGEAFLTKSSS